MTRGWLQVFKLMHEAVFTSPYYTRRLLWFLYCLDVFKPSRYNGYDGYNDYGFMLKMFNSGAGSEAQGRKLDAIIKDEVHPFLADVWRRSARR